MLVRLAGETNETVRDLAVSALGEIGSEPELAVPVLTEALGDADEWIRAWFGGEGLGQGEQGAAVGGVEALVDFVGEQ